MNAKTLGIVAGGAVVLAGLAALVVTRGREATAVQEYNAKICPGLAEKAKDVQTIIVNNAGTVSTVKKKGDAWVLAEKGGYPVKIDKVKEVVLGLAALTQKEPKTSKPDRYAEIGVEDPPAQPTPAPAPDPAKPDQPPPEKSQAALITLQDGSGATVASAIVGKQRFGNPPTLFVRKAGESQSWLAEGQVDVPREANLWFDTQIINLPRERVKSASITPGRADGSALVIERLRKEDTAFTVQGVPEGRTLKSPAAGDAPATALSYLNFDDVAQASTVTPPEGTTPVVYEVRTFDGMVVTSRVFGKEGRFWATFEASVDETSLPQPPAEAPKTDAGAADPAKPTEGKPAEAQSTDAKSDPNKPDPAKAAAEEAAKKAQAVRKEVADFNARHGGWIYAIPEYKAKTLITKIDELLADQTPPAPQGPAGPPAGPGPGPEPAPAEPQAPPASAPEPAPSPVPQPETPPAEPAPEPK